MGTRSNCDTIDRELNAAGLHPRHAVWRQAIGALAFLAASVAFAPARAGEVKQLGAAPDTDQLIQSLTPPWGEDGSGGPTRGLRPVSGKSSQTSADHKGTDTRAAAVALDVRFDTGSANLTDAARDTADRIGKALGSTQLAGYRFLIEGHTDSTGHPASNLVLSQKRAEAVKSYLVANAGIPADRLQTAGKGSTEPLDPAHPESGANRCVQIVNLGK